MKLYQKVLSIAALVLIGAFTINRTPFTELTMMIISFVWGIFLSVLFFLLIPDEKYYYRFFYMYKGGTGIADMDTSHKVNTLERIKSIEKGILKKNQETEPEYDWGNVYINNIIQLKG